MNGKTLALIVSPLLLWSAVALAADGGSVTISSPADGAVVTPDDDVELTYEATKGPNGDHLHLYLDGKRIDVIHAMKGKAEVGMLDPGKHHICLAVNTAAHIATGAEKCIDITSK
jgi:hypothetical protein